MRKLLCRIVDGDYATERLKGLRVEVKAIEERACQAALGFQVICTLLDDVPADPVLDVHKWKKGSELWLYSDNLDPIDTELIPKKYRDSIVLRQAWVFCEARDDAWYRYEPTDKAKYLELNGVPWKDVRVYDVGRH